MTKLFRYCDGGCLHRRHELKAIDLFLATLAIKEGNLQPIDRGGAIINSQNCRRRAIVKAAAAATVEIDRT